MGVNRKEGIRTGTGMTGNERGNRKEKHRTQGKAEDEQDHVHMRPAGLNGFELICKFDNNGKPDQVGMHITMSAFHKTESYHEEWKNRFNNLLDMKAVKLKGSNE